MNKICEMNELLELKRVIAYEGFNKLNLRELEPLRCEVQNRIDKLIAESEGKKAVLNEAKPT